jgi:subtilisin family serine protease
MDLPPQHRRRSWAPPVHLQLTPMLSQSAPITETPEPSGERGTDPASSVGLDRLMELTSGDSKVVIALLDGPVAVRHPDLSETAIRQVDDTGSEQGMDERTPATAHGTFVAGILGAKRGSGAPALCPDCTLLLRPIFRDAVDAEQGHPQLSASSDDLARAIVQVVDSGAHILNLSIAVAGSDSRAHSGVDQALSYAMRRGALVVAAGGNGGVVGSTFITRHPWVIPVVGFGVNRRPLQISNLAGSFGERGVGAPGEGIVSLSPGGGVVSWAGTSAAAPFVTGAVALIRSLLPDVSAAKLRATINAVSGRGRSIVPPLLDAWGIYRSLLEH